jgi:hypothetical protein
MTAPSSVPQPDVLREDLLALDPEILAAMANRGLVKRAQKDLEAGAGPQSESSAGEVRGLFPDGAEVRFPPGAGLDASLCTCAAPGICRHRICLVLAYQQTHSGLDRDRASESPAAGWSPGDVDDEALAALVGPKPLASARRIFDRGYTARVHRGGPQGAPDDRPDTGSPWVELPACTVRFPIPGNAAHAITDAAAARRGEAVALAVWAFRAADASGSREAQVRIEAGGRAGLKIPHALTQALDLTLDLIVDGGADSDPVLVVTLRRIQHELSAASLHWPAAVLGELGDQLEAYRSRNADYQHAIFARVIAELHARHRALGRAPLPAADLLGTSESQSVPLRRTRLTALGARVRGTDSQRTAEIYFAQPQAGLTLVLKRQWQLDPEDSTATDPAKPTTGHVLSTRRLLGATLSALAISNLVSEMATRSPSRVLTVASSRIAPTSVLPLGAAWTELTTPILVDDFQRFAASLQHLPPNLLRPRTEAEAVHLLRVAEVAEIGYSSADQTLRAEVRDEHGSPAALTASYNPVCPGSLDALADALHNAPTYISGMLSVAHGRLAIDPIAIRTADQGVIVPDFAPGEGADSLDAAVQPEQSPIAASLAAGLAALAELASTGLRQAGRAATAELEDVAARLARIGLSDCAALLRRIPSALSGSGYRAAAVGWIDAYVHLSVAAELHQAD